MSSERVPGSQQPQPQMCPFPLKLTKHSLESLSSLFPFFFLLIFATSDLMGRMGREEKLWKSFTFFFLKPPRGFTTFRCRWVFFLHPIIPGTGCTNTLSLPLPSPIRINRPKFHLLLNLKAPTMKQRSEQQSRADEFPSPKWLSHHSSRDVKLMEM